MNKTKLVAKLMSFSKLSELIDRVSVSLTKLDLENPRQEARLLVGGGLGLTLNQTLQNQKREITAEESTRISRLIKRRVQREPMAHIFGVREFWSLEFEVGPECLIPRPDSECLVEAALEFLPTDESRVDVLDLGTGSGCLLLSTLNERVNATGIGLDISYEAAALARRNACRFNLDDRSHFVVGNWGAAVKRSFDLIYCNPPYIRTCDIAGLMPEVSVYEPHLALDGGDDGLSRYREIAPELTRLLAPNGKVCVEVGLGQSGPVKRLFGQCGLNLWAERRDLGGIPRCLVFEFRNVPRNGSKKRLGKVVSSR